MMIVNVLHPAGVEAVGIIPTMLDPENYDKATTQLHANYLHGGGWTPFEGFILNADDSISYPGDPSYPPLAEMRLRHERIVVYAHGWVAVIQPDRSYEICRMD